MNTTATTGLKSLAETHVHESVVEALELLVKAKSILAYSYEETFQPENEELNLLRTARTEHQRLSSMIHQLLQGLDHASVPQELKSVLFGRTGTLMNELKEQADMDGQALRDKHKDNPVLQLIL